MTNPSTRAERQASEKRQGTKSRAGGGAYPATRTLKIERIARLVLSGIGRGAGEAVG
jgi:hypothetical protein